MLLTENEKTTINVLQKIEWEDLYTEARQGNVQSHVRPVTAINILATISQGLYNLPYLAN